MFFRVDTVARRRLVSSLKDRFKFCSFVSFGQDYPQEARKPRGYGCHARRLAGCRSSALAPEGECPQTIAALFKVETTTLAGRLRPSTVSIAPGCN